MGLGTKLLIELRLVEEVSFIARVTFSYKERE